MRRRKSRRSRRRG